MLLDVAVTLLLILLLPLMLLLSVPMPTGTDLFVSFQEAFYKLISYYSVITFPPDDAGQWRAVP
jgi:hypothetical protein